MGIKVLQPGLQATIQDLGRYGMQKFGVIVGGAMDTISLRLANLLVGISQQDGALEITLFGTSFFFESDEVIAITGGNLQPTINGEKALMWRPLYVRKGSVLKFHSAVSGCRAYVSFSGGIQVPLVMNSISTYLRAGIGGFQGRSLQKGDLFLCGNRTDIGEEIFLRLQNGKSHFSWSIDYTAFVNFNKKKTIRMIRGSEYEHFGNSSIQKFLSKPYTITTQTDRMGYRLEGESVQLKEPFDLLSEGVTYGTIQVPSNGQPIILMADRQTTGGYPKIGQVISADLPSLGQMQATDQVHFQEVTLEEAQLALIQQEKILNLVNYALQTKQHQ